MRTMEQTHYQITDLTAAMLIMSILLQVVLAVLFVFYMKNEVQPSIDACLSTCNRALEKQEGHIMNPFEELLEEGHAE